MPSLVYIYLLIDYLRLKIWVNFSRKSVLTVLGKYCWEKIYISGNKFQQYSGNKITQKHKNLHGNPFSLKGISHNKLQIIPLY